MVEPEKPFACTMPDCGMTFTNEDHLQLHTKKHDMMLQLGLEQKAAFVGKFLICILIYFHGTLIVVDKIKNYR